MRHRRQRISVISVWRSCREGPWKEVSQYGKIGEVVKKPEDPPLNLVTAGLYTFTLAIFHACHLVQPSRRDEYELSDAVDLLLQSGRTVDAIGLERWRVDVRYPEDRDKAEELLEEESESVEAKTVFRGGELCQPAVR
jgi:dTDP-glucose pyrophosphorylase